MNLLVTGGAGFIGSNFVRMALHGYLPGLEEARVTVLDALTYAGDMRNLDDVAGNPDFTFVQGDIRDADLVINLTSGVDAVVHFAAESHVDRSITGAADFVSTNVVGTQVLLDAIRINPSVRFLNVSTDEVYGSIERGSWPEDHPLLPNSPYSASKASADLLARAYARTFGLDVLVTRCSNNYGPYQFPEKVIPLFVTNLIEGKKVPLYGNGGNIRDWLHVDDHCRGLALALTRGRGGEIYNIGGGTELTNLELTHLVLELMGADESSIQPVTDRLGHDLRYSVKVDKIASELGYKAQVPFETGLAETIAWYQGNQWWWQPHKESQRKVS